MRLLGGATALLQAAQEGQGGTPKKLRSSIRNSESVHEYCLFRTMVRGCVPVESQAKECAAADEGCHHRRKWPEQFGSQMQFKFHGSAFAEMLGKQIDSTAYLRCNVFVSRTGTLSCHW